MRREGHPEVSMMRRSVGLWTLLAAALTAAEPRTLISPRAAAPLAMSGRARVAAAREGGTARL